MNEELSNNLKKAYNMCNGKIVEDNQGPFSRMYPFTNENIDGYIDNFDLKGKSLLTVGSSGDQVINAIGEGCTDITLLDLNPYVRYYYYLKVATLEKLNLTNFIRFLKFTDYPNILNYNLEAFNEDVFSYLTPTLKKLDNDSYIFWHELFTHFDPSVVRKSLFTVDEGKTEVITKINRYLNDPLHFEMIKKKIMTVKPTFITGDLFLVNLDKQYDNIWLSSIGPFLNTFNDIKKMVDKMATHLSNNGSLLISYLYQISKYALDKYDFETIYNIEKTLQTLKDYYVELVSFVGVRGIRWQDDTKEDAILLYRKR